MMRATSQACAPQLQHQGYKAYESLTAVQHSGSGVRLAKSSFGGTCLQKVSGECSTVLSASMAAGDAWGSAASAATASSWGATS